VAFVHFMTLPDLKDLLESRGTSRPREYGSSFIANNHDLSVLISQLELSLSVLGHIHTSYTFVCLS
jgi:hypothetical protein